MRALEAWQSQRPLVTVAVSQSLVARWLLPRLDRFAAAWPAVEVRLDVSNRLADIEHGEADLGIRCGPGHWPGPATEAAALARLPLIHDSTTLHAGVFPSWREWLHKQGVRLPKGEQGLRINSSTAVVQAALNGQGVALARRAFVGWLTQEAGTDVPR